MRRDGTATRCRGLNLDDPRDAQDVLDCQRAGYAVEAELIGFDGIPPLHETLEELLACGERFLGSYDEDGLAGLVSWKRLADGTVDIHRLVVDPRAFRRGHATALLDALDAAVAPDRTIVSTGTANLPALALYRRRGFVPVENREVAPGVSVTLLERPGPEPAALRPVAEGDGAWVRAGLPLAYDPGRDPYRVYLDRLDSADSRRTMRGCLDRIARIIAMDETGAVTGAGRPWWLLRYEHTTRIRAELRSRTAEDGGPAYSPASVNKHLVALRQVLRECWRLGLMSAEDYQRAADLKSVEGSRLPRGHHLPGQALAAVLAVCAADTSPAGRRDAALLSVLYSTGARRAEIAGLALADYDPAERSLRVRGKRDKERLVYVTVEAAARLDAWVTARGRTPGALFPPISRAGRCRVRDGRLAHPTGQAIAGILARRLEQASMPVHTPHDFRRTFIGELLDAGVDLATAQQLAGHASPATTARYDRRPQRRRRDAVDRLRLP